AASARRGANRRRRLDIRGDRVLAREEWRAPWAIRTSRRNLDLQPWGADATSPWLGCFGAARTRALAGDHLAHGARDLVYPMPSASALRRQEHDCECVRGAHRRALPSKDSTPKPRFEFVNKLDCVKP